MYDQILVPLNGTPEAAVALPPACMLAKATGATIILVRVVQSWHVGHGEPEPNEAQSYLQGVAREVAGMGLRVETTVPYGDVVAAILAEASGRGADLIVMATHGRADREQAVMGSVAARILGESAISVMLLRPGGRRLAHLRMLLAPVDGTPGASFALGTTLGLAHVTGAAVLLLQVLPPVPAHVTAETHTVIYLDSDWYEQARASARHYVEGLAQLLEQEGTRASGQVASGPVGPTIVRVAEDVKADLIVMSTHALTGPTRTILGSVAREVVRTARCPVLLVRRDEVGVS